MIVAAGGRGACSENIWDGGFGFGGEAGPTPIDTCAGGGGGGSSFIGGVTNSNTTAGVREGDGLVVLTFTPIVANIPTLSEWGLGRYSGDSRIYGSKKKENNC